MPSRWQCGRWLVPHLSGGVGGGGSGGGEVQIPFIVYTCGGGKTRLVLSTKLSEQSVTMICDLVTRVAVTKVTKCYPNMSCGLVTKVLVTKETRLLQPPSYKISNFTYHSLPSTLIS